ncbi:glycosyltransferase family 4 protein [Polaribacter sp. IC073]|uniref:glycosyltransferase family 4 protein n=1 Tax=Polaribacter sp. IC073 TaxID=2508540 RepID=UPI0011BF9C6F|nr:glycosyltransferase family 4 protein [Polaribacter sp. IC073]TXD47763.1 glycosyltransferase family 4 protein [Polaribacter sp. IC073]
MKKIIFIHLLNDFSGSPKVLSQVINNCKKEGYPVELYTGKSSQGFLSGLTEKHHYYFYKRFENKYATLFSFLFSQLLLFLKLLKYYNKDVVFYANTLLPFATGLAGKVLRKTVIYHVHETSISPKLFKGFLRFVVQLTASKVIFVSNSLRKTESFHTKSETVIFNSLPKTFTNKTLRHAYNPIDQTFFTVYMICSLKDYKGVQEFIKIAKLSEPHKKIHFTLILNVPQKDITNYFLNKIVPDNIKILPTQKKLEDFYKKASLVLNLSRVDEWVETFGLTIIEAMAFGIPVIVPPVGGPAEIVTNDKEGYLISSYEVEKIAQKILELSINKKKCLELSRNAYKRSLDFNEEIFNAQIIKTIEA